MSIMVMQEGPFMLVQKTKIFYNNPSRKMINCSGRMLSKFPSEIFCFRYLKVLKPQNINIKKLLKLTF